MAVDPERITKSLLQETMAQVRHAMAAQQVTQAELARRMGVSRSAVSQMLKAHPNLTFRRLAEVTVALGLTLKAPQIMASSGVPISGTGAPEVTVAQEEAPPGAGITEADMVAMLKQLNTLADEVARLRGTVRALRAEIAQRD